MSMDRPKALAKRPTKGGPAGDLIPLGSKDSKGGVASRSKSLVPSSSSTTGMKRESSSSSIPGLLTSSTPPSATAAKKPKLLSQQQFTALGRGPGGSDVRTASPTTRVYLYEELAKEVDPKSFLQAIDDASSDESLDALMCGAAKYLKLNRARPDPSMYLALMHLSRAKPHIFTTNTVTDAMSSLLRRDVSLNFKSKGNPLVSVLVCNVLATAWQEDDSWPDAFVKVYIDDSIGERVWVDRPDCRRFTENIQTAFGTKIPASSQLQDKQPSSNSGSPLHFGMDEEEEKSEESLFLKAGGMDEDVAQFISKRYSFQRVSVEAEVVNTVREQLGRRSVVDSGLRNLLRLLTSTAAYPEVRQLAAHRLEMWLQNPKLTKVAQDLLMAVCMNCDQHSNIDVEVMSQISKIRLKMKNLVNHHYFLAIRQLLSQHTSNLGTMMSHTIYNELSTSRNPNNMSLLAVMFSHDPTQAAEHLAEIFQELLLSKDDYLRALRALLREIVRSVRQDMNFPRFALGLMKERTDNKFKEMESSLKERLFFSLTDMITLTALLSVSSGVKEAAAAVARGDMKDLDMLRTFQKNMAVLQRDAVWWLHTVVPKMFEVAPKDYVFGLRKILFAESEEHYHKLDNWPPEGERGMLLSILTVSMPVLEDTLMRVLVVGLSKELHLTPADAIEIAEQLVRRAASTHASEDFPVLKMERGELFDVLFKLCAYKHPENIALPKGYQPPALAISNLYWKGWLILLIITAYNPSVFGKEAWEKYPTLRCLMEMTMANNYNFPPPTMATEERKIEEFVAKEKQLSEIERQEILEFEGYLAAATSKVQITQSNSLLIAQLTSMDPRGVARKPPPQVLDQLKWLKSSLQIGQMLCRSREPDFLLDIIHSQGPYQSMPWLAELVESSEGSLDVLPVQCLCEFLLHDIPTSSTPTTADTSMDGDEGSGKIGGVKKHEQLVWRLQGVLHGGDSDPRTIQEVLDYFLQRLTARQSTARQQALKGLSLVLSVEDEDEEHMDEDEEDTAVLAIPSHRWLLKDLPSLPQFLCVRERACIVLRRACQMETDAASVAAYIIFLSRHTDDMSLQQLDELALDMAHLIVERATLMNHLLPPATSGTPTVSSPAPRSHHVLAAMLSLFHHYLVTAQQPKKEAYSWSNTQDQILLQWESGEDANMNILVVHAMVILLTYGSPAVESRFTDLMCAWFPTEDGSAGSTPTAYLVDTSEEALLFPDWLKLRMIRCHQCPLVEAALQDLEPSQLLLFVQSFGIPIWSMSKLLHYLDRAVELDCEAMAEGVVDKGYMAQLVEVQHMRGATGGDKFKAMLTQDSPQEADADKDKAADVAERRGRGGRGGGKQWRLERTPTLPSWESSRHISSILTTVFLQADTTTTDRLKTFRSLQKSIATDQSHAASTITSLTDMLTGTTAAAFVGGLVKHANLALPMLRTILAKSDWKTSSTLFTQLQEQLKGQDNSLASFVNTSIAKHTPAKPAQASDQAQMDLKQVLSGGGAVDVVGMEKRWERAMLGHVTRGSTSAAVQQTCQMLMQTGEKDGSLDQSVHGLLVDWLRLLDPELVSTCPPDQQRLLFSSVSCQAYLLAMLTHTAGWSTLHSCIHTLLGGGEGEQQGNIASSVSASSALDFLSAVLHIPKVWQGRDKKLGKKQPREHVLKLSPSQMQRLIRFVVAEIQQKKGNQSDGGAATKQGDFQAILDRRTPLLLECCSYHPQLTRAALDYLQGMLARKGVDSAACQALLQRLYLALPYHHDRLDSAVLALTPEAADTTQLDVDTHHMLTALNSAAHGQKAENRMFDANIACRKLASEHPALLLRQLPMLASILQGRAQYSFAEVKHRNHLLLYTHVLGLLELLEPHLFHAKFSQPLADIFTAFFQLIKLHGTENRQLGTIIHKFVQFVHHFLSHDGNRAARMLQQYTPVIDAMSNQYRDLPLLRSVLAAVSLPREDNGDATVTGKEEAATDSLASSTSAENIPMTGRPVSPFNVMQLTPFINKIAAGSPTDDVLEVLEDLDETSKRKVDILQHFLPDLKRLASAHNALTRDTAHSLIMRHIRHTPRCAREFVGTYLQCLDSDNQDIITSALKQLPELILLAQDNAEMLLCKAFTVGALTKIETENYITEAIQLLNMDTLIA